MIVIEANSFNSRRLRAVTLGGMEGLDWKRLIGYRAGFIQALIARKALT